ncbi:cAMP and cAMP-inhibited cGMP 3',5'-cyclic phosphodiesterase 10A-like isoform X2 [Pieris rapae]|uniref:cAMP and cAMP-inhibited cGMP 3',5'-cyclic phosphodiesterase 10A-like isoform X2 n=1 Tax=Pieris rapae TaxID=64459 RepID=UPI001E27B662|nr:cAMP and cAMP-inhibited cGMP 3',5'-cyclic phosphodiesterase 10A-like isoform X2 [Pieris rapae]
MVDPTPRSVKSVKSRLDTIKQGDEPHHSVSKVQSHFLVPSDKLDKITRRVIAPYAQIERKDVKEEVREGPYLDINRFNVFLEDTVDLNSLLYETANVLKAVTNSSGVFVYIVDPIKNEIILMTQNTKNPERHEVNIPIEEGKIASAHVAFTKEYLVIEDVQRDRRFAEGLKWVDAKVALCMPVLKPDGDCYAVLELFRTHCEPYDHNIIYTVVSVACWSGAAVHQAQARITLQKTAHLNSELRTLLHNYFCDLASIDTMLTDMLAVIKSFIGAMRSSFFIIDREHIGEHLQADMWDDGWSSENTTMPRRKMKVNLSQEQTPAGLVARTGQVLNLRDVYRDPRFTKEIDPTTGTVVRTSLVAPIMDKNGVIGVVQLTNKTNTQPFDTDDEMIFGVFVNYCSLIVHFYNMQTKKIYHENLNKVYSNLMGLHLVPCRHDLEELMETNGVVLPPPNFKSYNYHISEGSKEDMPGLVCSMFVETFADRNFERQNLADFVLTVLLSYRDNPYHNAEHAFVFTHTMYLILVNNTGYFDFVEDKNLLSKLSIADRERIMLELKYNILCTDLAVYFQVRSQITPLLTDCAFDWTNNSHRRMLKGILMTTSDLSGSCKPFGVAKAISEAVYEEFYNQGDKERALGYTPLSMMDRRRYLNQPPEQIQFLSVVVIPCLMIVQTVFPNTGPLLENCRKTQEAWHEEIAIRGQKLWRQSVSVPRASRNLFHANTETTTN